jgi:hypothetical protein
MRLCPFDIFDIGGGSIPAEVYQRGENGLALLTPFKDFSPH